MEPTRKNPAEALPKTPPPEALAGAVCAQYRRCGKANCRCARGRPHGPYFYRFWREGGRLRKEYVPRAAVEAVRAACARRRQAQADARDARASLWELIRTLEEALKEMGYE